MFFLLCMTKLNFWCHLTSSRSWQLEHNQMCSVHPSIANVAHILKIFCLTLICCSTEWIEVESSNDFRASPEGGGCGWTCEKYLSGKKFTVHTYHLLNMLLKAISIHLGHYSCFLRKFILVLLSADPLCYLCIQVLSLPEQGNAIGFAAAGDYNSQQQDSHQRYKPGQRWAML